VKVPPRSIQNCQRGGVEAGGVTLAPGVPRDFCREADTIMVAARRVSIDKRRRGGKNALNPPRYVWGGDPAPKSSTIRFAH